MGEFSIFHWVIVVALMLFLTGIPLALASGLGFWIGKKLGDKSGYIRGYKEGQQSVPGK